MGVNVEEMAYASRTMDIRYEYGCWTVSWCNACGAYSHGQGSTMQEALDGALKEGRERHARYQFAGWMEPAPKPKKRRESPQ